MATPTRSSSSHRRRRRCVWLLVALALSSAAFHSAVRQNRKWYDALLLRAVAEDGPLAPWLALSVPLLPLPPPPAATAATTTGRRQRQPHQYNASLRDDLLRHDRPVTAEQVWIELLRFGNATSSLAGRQVWEVGMHRALQCLQAASMGFVAHCVEPSPTSFANVKKKVEQSPLNLQQHIRLYNAAAGAKSGDHVPFTAQGSTGDHVGHSNVWAMNATHADAGAKVLYVPTLRLDDVVLNTTFSSEPHAAFLAKIDTQGYEPAVLTGLSESLKQHKIPYILTEYWPRGMDFLLAPSAESENDGVPACLAADVLQDLADFGYTLYALPVQTHPKAPATFFHRPQSQQFPPLQNAMENCRYYYELERLHPSDVGYKIGYWSDILAVAPGFDLPSALLPPS